MMQGLYCVWEEAHAIVLKEGRGVVKQMNFVNCCTSYAAGAPEELKWARGRKPA
jgi:hypothetical protein